MKSLSKNSIYNVIYQCLNVLFPLITASYVSRVLLPVGIGKVTSAQNIVTYFTLIAALGLPTYGTKAIAGINGSRKQNSMVFSELFIINAISTIICSVAYYIMISSVSYFEERWNLYAICGIAIIFNIMNIDWFYQGKEEYRYIMLRNSAVKIVSLIACICFVKTSNDFLAYALILTIAKGGNYFFNIVNVRKYVSLQFKNLNLLKHLKPVITLLAASIAIEIYTLADTTMLTFLCGDEVVGYYDTALKAVKVVRTLITAIIAVFLPRLSFLYASNQFENFLRLSKKGIKIIIFLTIPATIGLIALSNDLILVLFGAEFQNSVTAARILSISIVSVAFSNFLGYQILITIGKERQMMHSTIIGAVIHIILNWLFIFKYQFIGVAVSSVITEIIVASYQFFIARKELLLKIDLKFLISVVLSSAALIAILFFCYLVIGNLLIRMAVSVLLGGLVYLVISVLTKNELFLEVIRKVGG